MSPVLRIALVGTVLLIAPLPTKGANCALRNPDRQIYEIFPEATSYRSVLGNVDSTLRSEIEEGVGGPISFNDLGKHTLYVVLRRAKPIGFIHARSEIGRRGSLELVWALDLDLTVKDFRVQRSREKSTEIIKASNFRARLVGRDYQGLRQFLTAGTRAADLEALQVPQEAGSIAQTVVHSGVKTLVITALVFENAVSRAGTRSVR